MRGGGMGEGDAAPLCQSVAVNRLKVSLSRQGCWIQPGSAAAHLLCRELRSTEQYTGSTLPWSRCLSAVPKTGVLRGSILPGGTDTPFLPLEGIEAIERLCGSFPITRQDFWVPVSPKPVLFGASVCGMLLQTYAIAGNAVQAGHQL